MDLLNYKNKKVLVMGLGVHGGGISSASFFAKLGANVLVTDLKSESELKPSLKKLASYPNIKYVLGEHREIDFKGANLVIRNPGVPKESKYLQVAKSAGAEIQMAEGIFFRNLKSTNVIAVTGTKGKTTTANLIYQILKANKLKVYLAGNMRKPVLEFLDVIKKDDWVVLELSSWQCEALDDNKISPKIAVITNISQDHLNRYPSYKDYALSKASIFKYQSKDDVLIMPKEIEFKADFLSLIKGKVIEVNLSSDDFYATFLQEAKIQGIHNYQNSLLALAVSHYLKLDEKKSIKAILNFNGVPYRMENNGTFKGVSFINDSAATAPAATLASLDTFKNKNAVFILGGADKNLDFTQLVNYITFNKVKYVLLKGSATDKLVSLGLNLNLVFDDFRKAIQKAYEMAKPKGMVVLSPGSASFGMFKHEFDRGDKFKKIIKEIGSDPK